MSMNDTKTVTFYYYKPCLEKDTTKTVCLEQYLRLIAGKIKQINTFDMPSAITINSIENFEKYEIPGGATLPYPIWSVFFGKSRLDIPGKINIYTKAVSPVSINDNELITDETVMLYDETTHIVMYQNGMHGASISQVQSIINECIQNPKDRITFVPLYYDDAFSRIKKHCYNRSFNARLIHRPNLDYESLLMDPECTPLIDMVKSFSELQGKAETDIKMEISIAVGDRKRNTGLNSKKFLSMLKGLLDLNAKGLVDRIKATGYSLDNNKLETIDLLEGQIKDKRLFNVTSATRYLSPRVVYNGMVLEYIKRRKDFISTDL